MSPERLLLSKNPIDFLEFFSLRKHTRLEGLVVEFETEQTLLKHFTKNNWRVIDAMVLRARSSSEKASSFLIFPRNQSAETIKDIIALGTELQKANQPVRSILVKNKNVYLRSIDGSEYIELTPDPDHNESHNIDTRVLAMFWGFAVHTPDIFCRFARDTVMKDCFIQPYFNRGLWDLDRFLISQDRSQIVYIETKHKYPIPKDYLPFGLNKGEVETLHCLKKTDISCWHTILLKPQWEKNISSTYLFYNRDAREKTLWIAADMKSDGFILNFHKQPLNASKDTSINSNSSTKYYELDSTNFIVIGENSLSSEILSERFYNIVCQKGEYQKVTREIMIEHKIN